MDIKIQKTVRVITFLYILFDFNLRILPMISDIEVDNRISSLFSSNVLINLYADISLIMNNM